MLKTPFAEAAGVGAPHRGSSVQHSHLWGSVKPLWQQRGQGGDTQGCLCPQVRCAAVFALGTFVGNSAERTDHSTTIDHNVAMMLAQLINDGSPMVRKVPQPLLWALSLSRESVHRMGELCPCKAPGMHHRLPQSSSPALGELVMRHRTSIVH